MNRTVKNTMCTGCHGAILDGGCDVYGADGGLEHRPGLGICSRCGSAQSYAEARDYWSQN